ncbi:hypothetical protein YH65_03165 [Sulfurovum lithotrophicum]|uniref:Lipoprotein n=1 Tax=Sulfurovum lithotrophicum TaxID=206403 RepID=A0A7U4M0B2_9BACT|nr:hypothetical protein [Sulfurovum lithotrophicum]AKF24497.1 hypothetical protein YH65_03165 [Sulfurovum lithotrophicum]
MKYLKSMTLSTTALLLLTACGSVRHVPESKGGFYYSGIYFGKNFSQTLKEGVEDGCDTSKGHYTKNHTLFNNDRDYNTGWFLGRSRCIPLFKVEEDEKPVNTPDV